ncbi:hypothetical protein ACFFV7_40690 [Nonomuraea spiralis]|uniref:Uncharacterized protein n=1 Tax=Nonomuraea spiralis TaxID=46182 RepID=A0ABV5IUH9_9ACTN|nr:hypothetical protein [Nonomuraea spiralis]
MPEPIGHPAAISATAAVKSVWSDPLVAGDRRHIPHTALLQHPPQPPGLHFAPDGEAVAEVHLADGVARGKIAQPCLARFPNESGHDLRISGIDMLRIEDSLITEVWSVSGGRSGRAFYDN